MITRERILELRAEGKTYIEIGAILGCSKSTVSYYVGVKKGPHNPTGKKLCKNCSKEIGGYKTYCNQACQAEYVAKVRLEELKAGKLHDNRRARTALLTINGNKCSLCPTTTTWNGRPLTLHVDHIDGNSDNPDFTNLRLVCPNCHSQLETSKSKVKKNTRRNSYLRKYKGY